MSTEQEHGDHVSVYVKLAIFLGVLTGAEVMVLWLLLFPTG